MNEDLHVAEWLVSRIEGSSGPGDIQTRVSGAYHGQIPRERPLPAVRFHVQAPWDTRGAANPAARIMTRIDWLIVVVHEGLSVSKLVPIADALDARLHESNGVCPDGAVLILQCIRLAPFHLLNTEDSGVSYRHAGGLYRTIAQPA